MRKILKRLGVGILALSLVFTPNMSTSASTTNRGGSSDSSVQSGSKPLSGCGTSAGFCFRIMLYDVPEDNNGDKDKLWKETARNSQKYQMLSLIHS